jgi:hypothetical protein
LKTAFYLDDYVENERHDSRIDQVPLGFNGLFESWHALSLYQKEGVLALISIAMEIKAKRK